MQTLPYVLLKQTGFEGYSLIDQQLSNDCYFGFTLENQWVIIKYFPNTNVIFYVTGSSDYGTNWVNRETLSYILPDNNIILNTGQKIRIKGINGDFYEIYCGETGDLEFYSTPDIGSSFAFNQTILAQAINCTEIDITGAIVSSKLLGVSYLNDAAAAAGGVLLGELYRNSTTNNITIRLT